MFFADMRNPFGKKSKAGSNLVAAVRPKAWMGCYCFYLLIALMPVVVLLST